MRSALLIAASLLSLPASAFPKFFGKKAAPATPPAEIAARLVKSMSVNGDDVVAIRADPASTDVALAFAVAAARAGAATLVTLDSAAIERATAEGSGAGNIDPFTPRLRDGATLLVRFGGADDDALDGISEDKLAARARTVAAVEGPRGPAGDGAWRALVIGGDDYPTESLAKACGVALPTLQKAFWDAVLTPPAQLAHEAAKLKAALSGNHEVRVTTKAGTDLAVALINRPPRVSTGEILPDQAKLPGGKIVRLPAGEVAAAPTEFSANGKVVVPFLRFHGKTVKNATLTFAEGKLTKVAANEGAKALNDALAASKGDKDIIGAVDVGLNPALSAYGPCRSYAALGVVTIGVGANAWAGGTNQSDLSLMVHLPDATLVVDGKTLVDNGKLVAPELPAEKAAPKPADHPAAKPAPPAKPSK